MGERLTIWLTPAARRVAAALLFLATGWALYNVVGYVAGTSGRNRAESAGVVLAAVSCLAASLSLRLQAGPALPWKALDLAGAGALFSVAVARLYYPAIGVGSLSDDYVLMGWAHDLNVWPSTWPYFRPLPLLLWHLVLREGTVNGMATLHALNLAVHVVNCALVSALAHALGARKREAAVCGLLFALSPLAVEPVVWLAGAFDLFATLFALGAVIAALFARSALIATAVTGAMTIAALLCKETGVVVPILVAIAAVAARRFDRIAGAAGATSAALVAVYLVIRSGALAAAPVPMALTAFAAKEFLVKPAVAFMMPIPAMLGDAHGLLRVSVAAGWTVAVSVVAAAWLYSKVPARFALCGAMWLIASVAPLGTMFFVADTLEASRYCYLGTAGWVIGVSLTASRTLSALATRPWEPWLLASAAVAAVTLSAFVSHAALSNWTAASGLRDRVLADYQRVRAACRPVDVSGLPDAVNGAFVFRNGFSEAVAPLTSGAQSPCSIRWNGAAFEQVPQSPP